MSNKGKERWNGFRMKEKPNFKFIHVDITSHFCIIYTIILLRSKPSGHHSKVLYHWGVRKDERQENTENRSEEKAQSHYSPQGNGRY